MEYMKTDILKDILKQVKNELNENGSVGFTMPDGKHHIFIYCDDEYYIIEPNRVIDGAHEPMGDTTSAEYNDFGAILVGCMWCMEQFEQDCEFHHKSEVLIGDYEAIKNNVRKAYIEGDVELAQVISSVSSSLSIEESFQLYAELRQEIDDDKVIYLKSSGEIYDIGSRQQLNDKELREIVSEHIGPEKKIAIDLDFAKLVAEIGSNPDYKEVFVSLEDKEGVFLQDLAVIGRKYHIDNTEPVYEDCVSIKVYSDKYIEDYTHDFAVELHEEEESKVSLDSKIEAAAQRCVNASVINETKLKSEMERE